MQTQAFKLSVFAAIIKRLRNLTSSNFSRNNGRRRLASLLHLSSSFLLWAGITLRRAGTFLPKPHTILNRAFSDQMTLATSSMTEVIIVVADVVTVERTVVLVAGRYARTTASRVAVVV